MREVTIQVSDLKGSTTCTTDLKNNPHTYDGAPSLLMIHIILFHTTLYRDKLLTTAGHLSSDAEINRPRYLKEFTISRGRP